MNSRVVLPLVCCWMISTSAFALDTVTRRSTDKRAAGEITEVTQTEVVVKPKVGSSQTVPANDIDRIEWDGEPAVLKLARSKSGSGQYESAIEDFNTAKADIPASRDQLRTDIDYGIAHATGKLALADPEQQATAVELLTTFINKHADHYRYFDALLVLGDVHLAQNDVTSAEVIFNRVASAPWPDYEMAANVAIGRAALARGDAAGARAAFEKVAAMTVSDAAEQSRQFEAMLGLATVLKQEKQFDQAAETLDEIIMRSAADDTRLQAEAYVRQGDCYAAMEGREKDAVMAYLHLDVIPSLSVEQDLHAEALYQLAQLWPQLGQPARADMAVGKLQSLYPNSPWTKKAANE